MSRKSVNRRIGLLSAAAAVGGSLAAFGRSRAAVAPLPLNHLGGTQRRIARGPYELFATELGQGPDLLLIHGVHAGASSFEFRRLAPLLAAHHRVIAFDFLGCGLSDHPNLAYSAELFVDQIIQVIGELTDGPLTLVGSSFGAAYAIAAAARAEDRVKAVVALGPAGLEREARPSYLRRAASDVILRSPVGSPLYAALTTRRSLASFLRRVYADERMVTPELLAHFEAVSRTPGARYVTAAFVAGELHCDLSAELPFLETPVLVVEGTAGRLGPKDGALIASLGNAVESVIIDGVGLLPHEEAPQRTCAAIESFLQTLEQR